MDCSLRKYLIIFCRSPNAKNRRQDKFLGGLDELGEITVQPKKSGKTMSGVTKKNSGFVRGASSKDYLMDSLDESVDIVLDESVDDPVDKTPEPTLSPSLKNRSNPISASPALSIRTFRRGNTVKPNETTDSFPAPPSAVTVRRVPNASAHAEPVDSNVINSASVNVKKVPRQQTASTHQSRRSSIASMSVINLDRSAVNLPLKADPKMTKSSFGVTVKKLMRGKSSTRQ